MDDCLGGESQLKPTAAIRSLALFNHDTSCKCPKFSHATTATSESMAIGKQPGGNLVGHAICSECTNDENANNAGATDAFVEWRSFLPRRMDSGLNCTCGPYSHINNGH